MRLFLWFSNTVYLLVFFLGRWWCDTSSHCPYCLCHDMSSLHSFWCYITTRVRLDQCSISLVITSWLFQLYIRSMQLHSGMRELDVCWLHVDTWDLLAFFGLSFPHNYLVSWFEDRGCCQGWRKSILSFHLLNFEGKLKISKKNESITLALHSVWKSPKMSNLSFSTLAFSTIFCPIDLSGNTVWLQASGFQKLAKWTIFWHF